MKKFKLAFTLAELMITLGLIGVIAAITIPVIFSKMPDRDEQMHNKVTQIVEDMVAQMANDDIMYPQNREYLKQGFKNTDPVRLDGLDDTAHTYEGDTKFCELFVHKFTRVYSEINCKKPEDVSDESLKRTFNINGTEVELVRTVRSGDNVDWYLPITDFQNGSAMIVADINTTEKGDNCLPPKSDSCKKPDTFVYYVRSNGTVVHESTTDGSNSKPYSITVNATCIEAQSAGDAPNTCYNSITLKNADGTSITGLGTSSSNSSVTFTNLESNKPYLLQTTPAPDYYSNWSNKIQQFNEDGSPKKDAEGNNIYTVNSNERAISLTGYEMNTKVKVRYNKQSKSCIILKVDYCEATSKKASDCVHIGAEKLDDGFYIGQDYSGIPDTTDVGVYTTDVGDSTTEAYTWKACGLPFGDYKLDIRGNSNYNLEPTTINSSGNIESATINQPIKLGSEDVVYRVTVSKKE